MNGSQRRRTPRLFWEGLLVLGPTLLLAGIGLAFLRQNRIWAEREAIALAQQTASDVASIRLPNALRGPLPPFDPLASRRVKRLEAHNDPVLEAATGRHPRIAMVVDGPGNLVFPPPLSEWPEPQALDLESIAPELRPNARALLEPSRIVAGAGGTADRIRLLLAQSPPREIAGLATYRLGRLLESSGEYPQARRQFEQVIEQFPDVRGEAGMPLMIFAGLRLLEPEFSANSTAGQRAGLISFLCAEALFRPSPFSPVLLRKLGSLGDQAELVKNASRVWEAHEKARELYEQCCLRGAHNHSAPSREQSLSWVRDAAGAGWLVVPARDGVNRWLLFVNEPTVRKLVNEAVISPSVPASMRVSVDLGGRQIIPPLTGQEPLASVRGDQDPHRALDGIFTRVYLANPAAFYAHVRLQTLWMSILIAVSILAVVVGLSLAGRAFRHQRQLVEMKSNFVSSVSHELRAPIASIRLLTEELIDAGAGPAAQKHSEYHQLIARECKRVSALIENVLDFSRSERAQATDEFAPTDLGDLVEQTLEVMRPVGMEKQICFLSEIRGKPVPVLAFASGLNRALVNLVDNAVKYSPAGATVSVGVDYEPLNDHAAAHVWVEDHGKGISPEDQQRIFEPFYRCGSELRRETQGVGLGLTLVQQIMRAHRGEVRVQSAVGQGSRFTLVLPTRARKEEEAK